jgi:hypothetical protein
MRSQLREYHTVEFHRERQETWQREMLSSDRYRTRAFRDFQHWYVHQYAGDPALIYNMLPEYCDQYAQIERQYYDAVMVAWMLEAR